MKKIILVFIVSLFSITNTYAQWPDIPVDWYWSSGQCNCDHAIDSVFLVSIYIVDVANGYQGIYADSTYVSAGSGNQTSFPSDAVETYCHDNNYLYNPSLIVSVSVKMICVYQSQIVVCKGRDNFGPFSCLDFSNSIGSLSVPIAP